ncbi:LysR family transcriptional regulator [Delftia sp. SD018]|uniref:LysR family transcriptional regulator n=1 Tax=unclassified Delftia TaxID=2613839 RepID=UPI001A959338|nr:MULTISPECIES: LysR family transcriptional regulator [unclassified Delftia]MBO0990032.1 LysR family transcriptional regulator [Delftia sp. SD083]MBO1036245.1 LysR family transcriptional regulator [Delftia sp. SD018]
MSNARLPSFRFLIGFETAARLGNYSRAAEELCISQSAVSHQIAQLEQQLGQPLFRRKGRGVELTVAGRLLLDSVGKSLDQIRHGLSRIETYMDDSLVTIVCPAPVASGWLQPRLDGLLQRHPQLCPIVSTDETARYIDELDVDIAITREPLRQTDVLQVPLLADELVAVRAPGPHTGDGLLCLEEDLTSDRTGPFIRQHLGRLRKTAIYDDARLLLDAALRGRGCAVVSRLLADEALGTGRLQLLEGIPPFALGRLWMSRIEGEPRMALVREVFDYLVEQAVPLAKA